MKQIILERNVEYAIWENIIYALVFLLALFIGTFLFSSGKTAVLICILSGILVLICILALLTKKGIVADLNLYRGYFLFSKLIYKKRIENPVSDKFTILHKKYRQKYIRSYKDPNWEYAVDSFELYFYDEDGTIQNPIIKCMKSESSEKAKSFLIENFGLKFKSI